MDVQRTLEANIEKRTKDIYGPPPGRRLIIFIDDMNMPQVDTYGTQQPIALLKLFLEKGDSNSKYTFFFKSTPFIRTSRLKWPKK